MTLYDIVGEYMELYSLLSDTEVEEQTVLDTLEGIEGDLEVKAEGYVKIIKQLDSEKEAYKKESAFFDRKAKTIENNIKAMKERLCQAMILTKHDDKAGLKAGNFTLKVQNNGGQQRLEITGEVPQNMTKVIIEPDNDKIRDFLKDHECEWAHLEPRGRHIIIK